VRVYNVLTFDRVDAVAPPYRGASLNSDLLFDFNDQDPAQYRLFDVAYVIAPPSATVAQGLVPIISTPKYVLYRAPGGGYAEYAAISRSEAPKSQPEWFESARAWLRGGSATSWEFVRYAYRDARPIDVPVPIAECPRPAISYQRAQPGRYDVLATCATDSAMVLKVTYHPNWHVTVAGPALAVAIAAVAFLVLAPFTPRIAFNDGLGFDGRVYAWLTQALRGDHSVAVVPPWSFRLVPSAIVALSGLEVKLGFLLLDLFSALGSAWLLYRLLRHYAVSPALSL